jgi:hypothetical protein
MIYMGYDLVNQGCLFSCERGNVFIGDEKASHPPADAVINGLMDVSEEVDNYVKRRDQGIEVIVTTPFTRRVQFSEQAWSDLLRVGESV